MKSFCYLLLYTCVLASCGPAGNPPTAPAATAGADMNADTLGKERVVVHPIFHASTVLTQGDRTLFIDPYNGPERYAEYGTPDLVLITHTHGDHLDTATLAGLDLSNAVLVAPQAVLDALTDNPFASSHALANGESYDWAGIIVTAVPAYNPPPKEMMHPEGKFNGYVLDFDGERYYFSGDTEGVPAMRNLKNIDFAFVCMNLPYTMDIQQAASAVLDFAPRVVYPYHYRNQDETMSDVEAFRRLIEAGNADIEVRLENWYPAK